MRDRLAAEAAVVRLISRSLDLVIPDEEPEVEEGQGQEAVECSRGPPSGTDSLISARFQGKSQSRMGFAYTVVKRGRAIFFSLSRNPGSGTQSRTFSSIISASSSLRRFVAEGQRSQWEARLGRWRRWPRSRAAG